MYGVIGSAVVLGTIYIQIIKKFHIRGIDGSEITFKKNEKGFTRYMVGGIIFGFGWAMTGACPGPLFIILGNGSGVFAIAILSAMLGTYVYGLLSNKLLR